MIIVGKTKSGKFVALGTGKITSDPRITQTKTGKDVCSFFICSDVIRTGKNKEYEGYKITAWDEQAASAQMFEKGDVVYVEGECTKDDYTSQQNGKDEYQITIKTIWSADIGTQVANIQLAVNDLIKTKYSGGKNDEPIDPDSLMDVPVPDFLQDGYVDDMQPDI